MTALAKDFIQCSLVLMMEKNAGQLIVYVGNAGGSDVDVLRLDDEGGLTRVGNAIAPGVVRPGGSLPLAISPDHRFLYAGVRGDPLIVASFAIDQTTGALTHLANSPLADNMAYLSTDRAGRYLFSASYAGARAAVNPISPDGVVQAPRQIVETEPNAHAVVVDRDNRRVLVPCLGGDVILSLAFDARSGSISATDRRSVLTAAQAGPRHIAFHPDGQRAYLLNELDATIDAFAYEARTGELTRLQTISALPPQFHGKPWAADIHVTPNGAFVYASERTSSTLAAFRIDARNGQLSSIGHFETETQPRAFAIDPTGRFLLAAGERSNAVISYAIDEASGKLTALKRCSVGESPNWVEIINLP